MTKRFSLRAAAAGLAVSGLLALAACGGDDGSSSETTSSAATTGPTGSASADDSTTVASGAGTTVAGAPATSAGGALGTDCRALAQEFAAALGGATNPTADPAQIGDAFSQLAASVPADLKDDVELVGGALGRYAEVYAGVGGDPATAATHPDVLAVFQELATPEYTAATQALNTYFTETCQAG